MGFFHRITAEQKAALEAIHLVLEQEDAVLDRKKLDCVAATQTAIRIKSWGFDAAEAERKHLHSLDVLVDEGLVVVDCGIVHDGTLMGCCEGYLEVRAMENGGFERITELLQKRLPSLTILPGFWGSHTLRAHSPVHHR